MASTLESTVGTRPAVAARDTRGYWRWLLAICAPLGWLVVGVSNLITPYELGGSSSAQVDDIARHQHLMEGILAAQPLFAFTFVPGVIAFILVCRRARPVFTAVLGTLGLAGALAGAANPPMDLIVLEGLRQGISHDRLAGLVDGLSAAPSGLALVFTFVFITFGRIALGVLLWTAGIRPRWCAALMAVSPFVEFIPLGLGNVQPALAWICSGIAMTGVSLALIRMRNDAFDLPPARHL